MGLLAQLLATAFAHGGRAWRVLGVALIVIHLIVAPLVLAFRSAWPMGPDAFFGSQVVAPPEDGEPEEHLVIVNAPSVYHALYMPVVRELNDQPVPRHVRHLAPGLPAVSLKRTDARTLVVRPQHGFTAWTVDRMFADARCPLKVGDEVVLTGVTIEVTALTDAGGPAEAVFRFDAPLEDPRYRWVQWTGKTYRAFTPPAVGESVELRPRGGWAPLVSLVVDHLRTLVFWR